MLVIRRRAGQAILIGDNIQVQITEVEGGRVKLGILAPDRIPIARMEVVTAGVENRRAADSPWSAQVRRIAASLRKKIQEPPAPSDMNCEGSSGNPVDGGRGPGRTPGHDFNRT